MQTALDFLDLLSASFEDYRNLSPLALQRLLKMGGKAERFLGPNHKEQP